MKELTTIEFNVSKKLAINENALARVTQKLPEISEQTRVFDRGNSQTTLSLMSLTMLNGHSPYRMLRQILAEIEQRKLALAEVQLSHAKMVAEIEVLENEERDSIKEADLRFKRVGIENMEGKINGALKDIAILIDAYENIKETNNIDSWDETDFETAEKKHHIRRGFELLYRNMIQNGRPHESSIEYLQQFGVHVQIALTEVIGYIAVTDEKIRNKIFVTSKDLENFLDQMATKYLRCADEVSEKLFGKSDFTNKDYMLRLEKKE